MLSKFEGGEIELRTLFEFREQNDWYIVETDCIADETIDLIHQNVFNIPPKYLPKEGFDMKKDDSEPARIDYKSKKRGG